MSHASSFNIAPRSGPADPVWSLLLIVGVLAALVLALPTLIVGLWTHGLAQLVSAQLAELIQNIQRFQAHLSRWNWRALWSRTWPLWLHSLLLVPLVALWVIWQQHALEEPGQNLRDKKRQRSTIACGRTDVQLARRATQNASRMRWASKW